MICISGYSIFSCVLGLRGLSFCLNKRIYIYPLLHYSFTRLLFYSFTPLLLYSFIPLLVYSFTLLLFYSFTPLLL